MKAAARFDLADLRLFVAIVEAGSITKGAAQAHLALASASERLRNIEDEAGTPLLQRRARGVATTEAGEALMRHARAMLEQHQLLRRELHEFAAGARGTLHLYANTGALSEYLPEKLAPWLAKRPHLHLELKERTSPEIVQLVAAGHAEAGIASDAVEPHELQCIRLVKSDLVLIVPSAHRLARHERLRFADALVEPFVGLSGHSALQDLVEAEALSAGGRLSTRIRLKTFEGLCEMVACGVGVGVIPLPAAQRFQARFAFRVIALKDAWASRSLCAYYRDWAALGAPMQSLLEHLRGGAGTRRARR